MRPTVFKKICLLAITSVVSTVVFAEDCSVSEPCKFNKNTDCIIAAKNGQWKKICPNSAREAGILEVGGKDLAYNQRYVCTLGDIKFTHSCTLADHKASFKVEAPSSWTNPIIQAPTARTNIPTLTIAANKLSVDFTTGAEGNAVPVLRFPIKNPNGALTCEKVAVTLGCHKVSKL